MSPKIFSIKAKDTKLPLLTLTVDNDGEKTKYTITEGTYREIGCPLSGDEIDADALSIMARADEERRAVAKALSPLSYADNNKKRLYTKLKLAGFSQDAAKGAVRECVMLGYVNEERQIEHLVLRYHRELHGPYKISARLLSQGYGQKEIHSVIDRLSDSGDLDFDRSRASLIEKKLPNDATAEQVKKLLYKYGYRK